MRMRYVLIVSSLLLISAVAAVLIELGTRGSTATTYTQTPVIGGHRDELTIERLATKSDLVVLVVTLPPKTVSVAKRVLGVK